MKPQTKAFALTLILAIILIAPSSLSAQTPLRFHNGELKIAQFTDIHWAPLSEHCATTEATILAVLSQEKPDMAVLTGDIVTDDPAMQGWQAIAKIFEKAQMPFVVLLGNHDAEHATKAEIYDYLTKCPYYIGEKGPSDIFGMGNCVLPVYAAQSNNEATPEALLYMIDSNDYPTDKLRYGAYDWIHFDQIAWYRQQSEQFTHTNNGKPLPALAFFHIPLPEFKLLAGDDKTYGTANEGVASPDINSGMMVSFIEMGDVMGMFVGHDHDNDYLGMQRGLLMAFGRTTGADAYGDLKRGARIIKLYEGQRKFDTWITTPDGREATYYYPSAINSDDEASAKYLPAIDDEIATQGVAYTYYEGECHSVAQIDQLKAKRQGTMPNFSIAGAAADDHFAYVYKALLKIDERGIYRFYTYSDDGSALYIDDWLVVDNDGGHSAERQEGKIALEKGLHRIRLEYFEDYMGQELEVGISGRNLSERPIPNSMLFLPER